MNNNKPPKQQQPPSLSSSHFRKQTIHTTISSLSSSSYYYRGLLKILFAQQDPVLCMCHIPFFEKKKKIPKTDYEYDLEQGITNTTANNNVWNNNNKTGLQRVFQLFSLVDFFKGSTEAELLVCMAVGADFMVHVLDDEHDDDKSEDSNSHRPYHCSERRGRRKRHARKRPCYSRQVFERIRNVILAHSEYQGHSNNSANIRLVLLVPPDIFTTTRADRSFPHFSPSCFNERGSTITAEPALALIPDTILTRTILGMPQFQVPALALLRLSYHNQSFVWTARRMESCHPHEELALEWNTPEHVSRQWLEQHQSAMTWFQKFWACLLFPSLAAFAFYCCSCSYGSCCSNTVTKRSK